MNTNIIDDHTYDEWCKELADLQSKYPKESSNVDFYKEEFKDFDGSTGYHLPKESWMHDLGNRLLKIHKEFKK